MSPQVRSLLWSPADVVLLGRTAVKFEIAARTGTSDLEDTGVLNTANGQTAGLDRVVVGGENGYVAGVVAIAAGLGFGL